MFAQMQPSKLEAGGYRTDARVCYTLSEGDELLTCPYDASHSILRPKFNLHLVKCRKNYVRSKKYEQDVKLGVEILPCKWKNEHHIRKNEMENHLKECPAYLDYLEQSRSIEESMKYWKTGGDVKSSWPDEKNSSACGSSTKSSTCDSFSIASSSWDSDTASCTSSSRKPPRYNSGFVDLPEEDWDEAKVKQEDEFGNKKNRFTSYDPRKKVNQEFGKIIQNPQGLTKSEKVAYREKLAEARVKVEEEEAKIKKEREQNAEFYAGFSRKGKSYKKEQMFDDGWN